MTEGRADSDQSQKHYAEDFDPEGYRKRLIERDGGKFRCEEEFFFKSMVELFEEGEFRGKTLLDIGSGPTVHNIVPACPRFSHIVLSDYVDANCLELKKWLRGDSDALDWSRLLTEAAKAQGCSNPESGRREIESLIRNNVKSVVHCDILADRIVPTDEPYDLVMTSLTLEAAAPDYEVFKQCLLKINALVKPQGGLIMKGFLGGSPWSAGDEQYPYLKLTREDIQKALEEAGFCKICWKVMKKQDMSYEYEFESCYCLSCVKDS